jgi:thioredoxin-related protein
MKNITILLGFILLISGKIYSQNDKFFFNGSFENAITKAKQDNKFVLIDFYTVWCGGCKAFDKFVFSKPEIQTYISDKFIALSIDAEKGEGIGLRKKYEIFSYPQIIIADSDGKEIDRISGYDSKYSENGQEFIKKINGILDGTSTLVSLEDNVRSNPTDIQLKEKLIYEYIQRNQYSKIITYAKELMQVKDSSIRDKGEFYYCYALIEDKETRNPTPIINLLNRKTSLINDYICAGYTSLLLYYRRKNDTKNIDFYYQKVIAADSSNWYYKREYALFLFENNLNIAKAQQIADKYYNAPGIVDHYQPLLMAYSFAYKNDIEKGIQIFDDWLLKYKVNEPISEKQWGYFYYADFANKYNIRLEKALEYAKEISDYRSGDIEIKIILAKLLYKNNKVNEAIEVLKLCLKNVQAEKHYSEINDLLKQYEIK